jgi:peptidoglycan/xylan/chitin deacetylase (PgdA/CDA1 family)
MIVFSGKNLETDACLSLTFDDGLKSHYTIVYPLLKEKNFSATFFIVANQTKDLIGRDLMTSEEIREIVGDGFEIGSHTLTHPFLTELSKEEIDKELKYSKQMLEDKYNISITSLATPYGDYNNNVLDIAKKYYLTTRAIYNKKPASFLVNSYGLTGNTSVEIVCKNIEYAKENGLWFILVFHDILDVPGMWDTSTDDFKSILKCAENSGIRIDSLENCRF